MADHKQRTIRMIEEKLDAQGPAVWNRRPRLQQMNLQQLEVIFELLKMPSKSKKVKLAGN